MENSTQEQVLQIKKVGKIVGQEFSFCVQNTIGSVCQAKSRRGAAAKSSTQKRFRNHSPYPSSFSCSLWASTGTSQAAQEHLPPQERLMALLDDVRAHGFTAREGWQCLHCLPRGIFRPRWDQAAGEKDQGVEHGWSSTRFL